MHNILLFEPDQEKVPHSVFLLKLADIHCTVAKTAEEILNWVNACRMMVTHFDLILLNSLQGSGLDTILLTELCEQATVPVVCVQRQEVPPSLFLIHNVITCHPDYLLDCLQEQFNSLANQLTKEKVQ
ncbi:MAG: hypothetical protein L3J57_13570 [Desulfuromusa sp.]|nr:hypothetical protein [Desulfuromusa sp.]